MSARVYLIILLLILIPALSALIGLNSYFSQPKPKVTKINKTIEQVQQESHPSLYALNLRYDPNSNTLSKINSGEFRGDLPELLQVPSSGSAVLSHKIETVSLKGKVLYKGWLSLNKSVIINNDGSYSFEVVVPYQKDETVNIYSVKGEKLWQERIN